MGQKKGRKRKKSENKRKTNDTKIETKSRTGLGAVVDTPGDTGTASGCSASRITRLGCGRGDARASATTRALFGAARARPGPVRDVGALRVGGGCGGCWGTCWERILRVEGEVGGDTGARGWPRARVRLYASPARLGPLWRPGIWRYMSVVRFYHRAYRETRSKSREAIILQTRLCWFARTLREAQHVNN